MASKEVSAIGTALDELPSDLFSSPMMVGDVRRRGSDGAKIDVEVDDEDVWLGRVDVFAFGVDGKDVRSGVVEKKLDVSLAKDEGEGTRQPSSGERRPKRSFTHSMDRRMSHTLPAFQLDDVLKRLRMGNFDRISSDAGGRNYQTIYRTLTAEKTAGERRRRVERQGKNNRGR
jgi:hypothetical protein